MIDRRPHCRFASGIPLLYAGIMLVATTLTRIGLALWAGTSAVPPSLWPAMLAEGLWFDLAALAAMLAPVLLYADEAVAYYQTAARAFREGALKSVAAAPRTQ